VEKAIEWAFVFLLHFCEMDSRLPTRLALLRSGRCAGMTRRKRKIFLLFIIYMHRLKILTSINAIDARSRLRYSCAAKRAALVGADKKTSALY
jgi:hypothetical protein